MKEIWKDVLNYEGKYQVSNFGEIKSLKRKYVLNDNILIGKISNKGYRVVLLHKDNKFKQTRSVHRIVLEAFIGVSTLVVNHKDGNKLNNNLNNLEYCTHSENLKHAYKIGLNSAKGVNNNRARFTNEDIILIRKLYNDYNIKQGTIALLFDTNQQTVSRIANKTRWSHI